MALPSLPGTSLLSSVPGPLQVRESCDPPFSYRLHPTLSSSPLPLRFSFFYLNRLYAATVLRTLVHRHIQGVDFILLEQLRCLRLFPFDSTFNLGFSTPLTNVLKVAGKNFIYATAAFFFPLHCYDGSTLSIFIRTHRPRLLVDVPPAFYDFLR